MKYVIIIIISFVTSLKSYSQLPCSKNINKEQYIEDIVNLNMGPRNTLLVLKLKDTENKIRRYLISSRDFAELIHVNYYIDTSFASIVKKVLLGENIKYSIDSSKLKAFLIPESLYVKYRKSKPCSIYKQFFNKKGFPKKEPIYYYNWGEYITVLTYLVDNYSIIIVDDLSGIFIYRKPCCLLRAQEIR